MKYLKIVACSSERALFEKRRIRASLLETRRLLAGIGRHFDWDAQGDPAREWMFHDSVAGRQECARCPSTCHVLSRGAEYEIDLLVSGNEKDC